MEIGEKIKELDETAKKFLVRDYGIIFIAEVGVVGTK